MRFRIGSISVVAALLSIAFALGVYAGTAGEQEPPGPPGSTSSFTLEDVYDRLATGTAGAQSAFAEPGSGPGTGTMHSLDAIMGIAPAADNTSGALPAEVLADKTFWSLRTNSAWGLQTGTAVAGDDVPGPEGSKTFAIPDGFYSGKTATANDSHLAAGNIKSGVDILGVVGTYPPAPVPKTGVTETLASADDGDLEKGVVWPNPQFTIHDNGTSGDTSDDTVTDNLTGLMWTRDADHMEKWKTGTAYPALEHCINLTLGGYDDWRLPNVRELQSLVHYGFDDPAVPNTEGTGQWSEGGAFIGVQSDGYWSSTTVANDDSFAWAVSMYDGRVWSAWKDDGHVWPVRGGQ